MHLSLCLHAKTVSEKGHESLTLGVAPEKGNSVAGKSSREEIYFLFYTLLYFLLYYVSIKEKNRTSFKHFKRICGNLSGHVSWKQGAKGKNRI